MMPPGVEPLKLFRTVAHNPAVLERFRTIGAYILNFGRVEPLDREVLLHRTCARCGCEYEWGVHAVAFGRPLGLSDEQLRATVHGRPRRTRLVGPPAPARAARGRAARHRDRVRVAVDEAQRPLGLRAADRADRDCGLLPPGVVHRERRRRAARGVRRAVSHPRCGPATGADSFATCAACSSACWYVLAVALAVNTVVTDRETEAGAAPTPGASSTCREATSRCVRTARGTRRPS